MFGKKKSASDQFIMARGRAVGNLPKAKVARESPTKQVAAAEHKRSGRHTAGALGHVKKILK